MPDKNSNTNESGAKDDTGTVISNQDETKTVISSVDSANFQNAIKVGSVIDDRFEILSALGQGGMGAVFLAKQPALGRLVAIKILHSAALTDSQQIKRFRNEAKALALLQHPQISACHSFGIENGQPYLVMEHLQGKSLSTVLKEDGKLSIERSLDITLALADALAYAHKKGIIHRDIKPSNIMLCVDATNELSTTENVKLLDFGIAKLLPESGASLQKITQSGELIGTLTYMSPEQCSNEPLDQRSDLFSLGAVLYEMLSGAPAFKAESALATFNKILKEDPAPIKRKLPKALQIILKQCLAKDRNERYQSLGQLAEDLQKLRQNPDSEILELGKTRRVFWSFRSLLPVLLAALFLSIFSYIACFLDETKSGRKASTININEEYTTPQDREEALSLEEKGRNLYDNKKFRKAALTFEQAIKKNPSKADYYFGLGNSLLVAGQEDSRSGSISQNDAINAANAFAKSCELSDKSPENELKQNNMYKAIYLLPERFPGDFHATQSLLEALIRIARVRFGANSLELGVLENRLGENYEGLKRESNGAELTRLCCAQRNAYLESCKILTRKRNAPIDKVFNMLSWLHDYALATKNDSDMQKYDQQVLDLIGRDKNADLLISIWYENRVNAFLSTNRYDLAQPWLEQLCKIATEKGSQVSPSKTALYIYLLGKNYNGLAKYSKAEATLKDAISRFTKLEGKTGDKTVSSYGELAQVYVKDKKLKKAESSIALIKSTGTACSTYNLARIRHVQQNFAESIKLFEKAMVEYKQLQTPSSIEMIKKCQDEIDAIHNVYHDR